MSDPNVHQANGRSDPADRSAGELADWWDRRAGQRRAGSTNAAPSPESTAVVQLEALARADDLSAPHSDFLADLEKQLMQTPPAAIATSPAPPHPQLIPIVRLSRRPRQGRGLIDLLTVAAVLALLLGGSWSVWNNGATAPTPDGQNGVAGVSTPDDDGADSAPSDSVVALDQSWATNQSDDLIGGSAPVDTSDCQTPPRQPGAVTALIENVSSAFGAHTELATSLFPDLEYVGASDDLTSLMEMYPEAPDDQRPMVDAAYAQVVACRFDNGKQTGESWSPFTGAYWNLFAADYFLDRFNLRLTNPTLDLQEVVDQSFSDEPTVGGQGAYPARILDVRTLPADTSGNPRLLVLRESVLGFSSRSLDVLVLEDGQWRFAGQQTVTEVNTSMLLGFPVDVAIGPGASGATSVQIAGAQFEADVPIAMTVANRGSEPQTIDLDGQPLGTVQPGTSLRIMPFVIPEAEIARAGGRIDLQLSTQTVSETNAVVGSTANLQVFPAGGLARRFGGVTGISSTPSADATPQALASDANRVVELDQPWAVSTGTVIVDGIAPVDASQCQVAPRAPGAILDLVEHAASRPPADFPDVVTTFELDSLFNQYPEGTPLDRVAAERFSSDWSACRFAISSQNAPIQNRYTAASYALLSDDNLLRTIPEGRGRTAESLVRQFPAGNITWAVGPYPDRIVDVRVYPADERGQPRLLVRHESITSPFDQVSLLVLESGTWRLAERPDMLVSPSPATPGFTGDAAQAGESPLLTAIDFDVAKPNSVSLNDWGPADVPIALTITDTGTAPSTVLVGEQSLGSVQPGQTIRVIPFIVSSAGSTALLQDHQLTVTSQDAVGHDMTTSWNVSNRTAGPPTEQS